MANHRKPPIPFTAVQSLEDLPNIGPALAGDLRLLGIETPAQLVGRNPLVMYRDLCAATGTRQDPCVLDVFMALTDFAGGGEARPWWTDTSERKIRYGQI